MSMSRNARAAGVWGHLLFVVVLAFSVLTMHTLGHPDEHPGPHMGATGATHSAASQSVDEADLRGVDDAHSSATVSASQAHKFTGKQPMTGHMPSDGMNPASVCLAVLGSLLVTVLLRAIVARWREWGREPFATAVALLRPNAPPPRCPDLAHLSVLRI